MQSQVLESDYTLVIAEKPDAGRRIANALGEASPISIGRMQALDVRSSFDDKHYVVCSAAGHLYAVANHQSRSTFPVFDLEWLALDAIVAKRRKGTSKRFLAIASGRIKSIRLLAKYAREYIQACDYDLEGETIGFNILEFACSVKSWENCKRAKFSTLTQLEIRSAFSHLENINMSLAAAGRTRHFVDFIWGVNLSRALSGVYKKAGHGYRNITIGRVQGPTLSFVVDREIKNKTHVPIPFWQIFASLRKEGITFVAQYELKKIQTNKLANVVMESVRKAKRATVKSVRESLSEELPPYPFNLGDLQSESFRLFRLSPSVTLKLAEKLYLKALISYPRTSSQKLPESTVCQRIIRELSSSPQYRTMAREILNFRRLSPRQGSKEDLAHPAIHPTGVQPGPLGRDEKKLYDLIVRRFLATFGETSLFSNTFIRIEIGSNDFETSGRKVLKEGWMKIYHASPWKGNVNLPQMREQESLDVISTNLQSEFEKSLRRFTSATLLREMEIHDLGTKATRAGIISTLTDRGYLTPTNSGELEASEIGLELVETMRTYCEEIISLELTRRTESDIEKISRGEDAKIALNNAKQAVSTAIDKILRSSEDIGSNLVAASKKSNDSLLRIGKCPSCAIGYLRVIKSQRSGKRFIGCSEFENGCRETAPIPQKGTIRPHAEICPVCYWPKISVFLRFRRTPWVICPNMKCTLRNLK